MVSVSIFVDLGFARLGLAQKVPGVVSEAKLHTKSELGAVATS
jgi:hypothetical protein